MLRSETTFLPFAIRRDELVGGTNCTPHEGIEFGVALPHAFDILLGIIAVSECFNDIDDAEIVFLLIIIPIYAYLPAGKQLYLLWHILSLFQALLVPVKELSDSVLDFDFMGPAQRVELADIDELAHGSIGLGGVELDCAGEANGFDYEFA